MKMEEITASHSQQPAPHDACQADADERCCRFAAAAAAAAAR